MRKYIHKFFYMAIMLTMFVAPGCKDDIAEELTELELSRLFSPTGVDARIINQTSIRLNWKKVNKAQTYTVEFHETANLDFSGSPFKTLIGITYEELPLTVSGFAGETSYSIRIKAVGDQIGESHWITASVRTDTEQIMLPVAPEEITATGVTLRWTPGEFATHILLTPGDINRPVTAEEVTNGMAIITGLASETNYTAELKNGLKTRGTRSFTTLIDLGGATAVHPEDDLRLIISDAADGAVLVLFPGNYTVATGDITLDKSITIKGLYPHDKPVIYNRFLISAGVVSASFMDLEMVGTIEGEPTKLAQAFLFNAGTYNLDQILISGCIIRDYNHALIYGGSAVSKVENLTIYNCIMSNIANDGGDFIDFRSGHVVNLNITNSTFNRVAAFPRDFIRLDNSAANFPGSESKVLIDRCTFYQVSNARRILYVRFNANSSTVTNTLFAGADGTYTGYYSNQAGTTQPVCNNNNYFNAPAFLGGVTNGKFDTSGTHKTLDPGFVNAATGNFKVTNQDIIFEGIGDPRWLQ